MINMVQACCVPGCTSGNKAPSYKFPRNAERRLQWYKSLNMKPVQGLKKQKLRVCYKHFRDGDYKCSNKLRVLLRNAIPSTNLLLDERNATEMKAEIHKNTTPEDPKLNENIKNEEEPDALKVQLEDLKTQQLQTKETVIQYSKTLTLQQEQINGILQEQKDKASEQEMQELKVKVDKLMELTCQTHSRPDIRDVTRKRTLSPKAGQPYDAIVQLKRQKRRLKKLQKFINTMMRNNV